jgi:hypothetical protein
MAAPSCKNLKHFSRMNSQWGFQLEPVAVAADNDDEHQIATQPDQWQCSRDPLRPSGVLILKNT